MKRYEDPIDVETAEGTVEAFWWRGNRYVIRRVLTRWREAGGWWEASGDVERPWLAGDAREVYRLDARSTAGGRLSGVYEIAHDVRTGAWSLCRVWD